MSQGNTALMIASWMGMTDVLTLLIQAGVDIKVKSPTKDTALTFTQMLENPALKEKIVKILTEALATHP